MMKKFNLLLMALGGALILTLGSCGDECDDITCENGATCDEGDCTCTTNYFGETCADWCVNGDYSSGNCDCDAGYEGDACTVESRSNYVGSYNADDNCGFTYANVISNGNTVAEISISNFAGFLGATVNATITSETTFTIASQTDAAGRVFVGSGTLSSTGNTVTVSYTVTYDDGTNDSCVATLTRV